MKSHGARLAFSSLLAAAILVSTPSSAQVFFGPWLETSGPCSLWGKAVADFDGDGHLDAALPNFDENAVSLFLGRGDGTLQHVADHAVGDEPWESAAADFDEDGNIDVVVINNLSDDISVLLGDGMGSFAPESRIVAGDAPKWLIATDLDGDGHTDVGVINEEGVWLLMGDGAGAFAPPQTYPVFSPTQLEGLATADLNDDGLIDIVVGGYEGLALVADGMGGFEPSFASFSYFYPAMADLNGDSQPELITALGHALYAWRLNGSLSFEFLWSWDIGNGNAPYSTTFADLDEDGFIDIVSAAIGSLGGYGGLAVTLTDANAGPKWRRFDSLTGVLDVLAHDFDEDGHTDILVPSYCGLFTAPNVTFAWLDALRGNVNAAAGTVTPALFVNGSSGTGSFEPLEIGLDDPLMISVEAPPSRPRSRFAMYAWPIDYRGVPYQFLQLPFGLGATALPTPLLPREWPQPNRIANNLGYAAQLGVDNWPGPALPPAPAVLLNRPNGLGRAARFFLQGFILDSAAPNGQAAVTNGIDVRVR